MTKRAQGRNKLGLKNFKRRYFCLTTKELYYSKTKGELLLKFMWAAHWRPSVQNCKQFLQGACCLLLFLVA